MKPPRIGGKPAHDAQEIEADFLDNGTWTAKSGQGVSGSPTLGPDEPLVTLDRNLAIP